MRAALALLFFLHASLALGAGLPRVVVVESYHAEHPWDAAYRQSLNTALAGKAELEYRQLDSKRQPTETVSANADAAWESIEANRPAAVVLADEAALVWLGRRARDAQIPIVFLGMTGNPRTYNLGSRSTGVLQRPLILRNLALVRQFIPKAQRVLILFDTDLTARVLNQEVMHGQDRQRIGDVEVDWRMLDRWDEWQAAVRDAPQRYDALFIGLNHTMRDRTGRTIDEDEVVTWSREHSRIPLFGYWDFSIGPDKAVGGLVLDGAEQGQLAAEQVSAILAGTSPDRLPLRTAERGRLLLSRKGLAVYHLTVPDSLARQSAWTD